MRVVYERRRADIFSTIFVTETVTQHESPEFHVSYAFLEALVVAYSSWTRTVVAPARTSLFLCLKQRVRIACPRAQKKSSALNENDFMFDRACCEGCAGFFLENYTLKQQNKIKSRCLY